MNPTTKLILGRWCWLAVVFGTTAASLFSQRTLVVDSANGPYYDLQPALLASQRGDTILIRPGNGSVYNCNYDIRSSRRIVAPGPVTPIVAANGVISVPASDLVVIDNLRFGGPQPPYGWVIDSHLGSPGTLLLSRLYRGNVPGVDGGGMVSASNCGRVIWTDCHVHYGCCPAVFAGNSNVYILDCDMESDYIWPFFLGQQGEIFLTGNCRAWIVNTRAKGGNYSGPGTGGDAGLHALGNSQVFIGGRSSFIGGTWQSNVGTERNTGIWLGDPGVIAPTDLVVLDPLTISNTARYTQGHEIIHEMPVVSPGDAIRGQSQRIALVGPTQSVMALFVSLMTPRPPIVTDMGDIWLDPATTMLLGAGAVDTRRDLVLNTTIPNWLPVGEVILYQAISLSQQNMFELSPPGFAVVH